MSSTSDRPSRPIDNASPPAGLASPADPANEQGGVADTQRQVELDRIPKEDKLSAKKTDPMPVLPSPIDFPERGWLAGAVPPLMLGDHAPPIGHKCEKPAGASRDLDLSLAAIFLPPRGRRPLPIKRRFGPSGILNLNQCRSASVSVASICKDSEGEEEPCSYYTTDGEGETTDGGLESVGAEEGGPATLQTGGDRNSGWSDEGQEDSDLEGAEHEESKTKAREISRLDAKGREYKVPRSDAYPFPEDRAELIKLLAMGLSLRRLFGYDLVESKLHCRGSLVLDGNRWVVNQCEVVVSDLESLQRHVRRKHLSTTGGCTIRELVNIGWEDDTFIPPHGKTVTAITVGPPPLHRFKPMQGTVQRIRIVTVKGYRVAQIVAGEENRKRSKKRKATRQLQPSAPKGRRSRA